MKNLSQTVFLARGYLETVLSSDQRRSLRDLAIGNTAYCFLEGFPVRAILEEQDTFATSLALGVLGILGLRPVSYRNEYNGSIVHDIMPREGVEAQQSSGGRVPLPFHTDMAFLRFPGEQSHPFRAAAPDFLVLAGVVNLPGVATKLVELSEAQSKLTDSDLRLLSSPVFNIESPATVVPRKAAQHVPILLEHGSHGSIFRFNDGGTASGRVVTGNDDRSNNVLRRLSHVLSSECSGNEFNVQPGTVLVFNNRKVVHGRGAIQRTESKQSGQDRHFKRVYGQFIDSDSNPLHAENPFMQSLGD